MRLEESKDPSSEGKVTEGGTCPGPVRNVGGDQLVPQPPSILPGSTVLPSGFHQDMEPRFPQPSSGSQDLTRPSDSKVHAAISHAAGGSVNRYHYFGGQFGKI